MGIKRSILLISIFSLAAISACARPPSDITDTPESPDSTTESPDSTPESPDSTPEAPDDDYSPNAPDEAADGYAPPPEAPTPSATFTILPGGSYPELDQICGATDYPIECVRFISPYLNDSIKIDPLNVLKVGIHVATNMTIEALNLARKIRDDPRTSPNAQSCLSVCAENYDLIPDGNELALRAIEERNWSDLRNQLSGDLTSVNTCIDVYHEGNLASPMRDMDSDLLALYRVLLHIAVDMVKF
ncbi:pectinesterase inhibitor 10-like [Gossypium arboreum]|uniref:pectinesterase inhibitor 10-like n=1 Tax=Gossypium arboreum TaxID=29729 RepID=UPI00081955B8|nr:pectinesterase inhibitor 10-like [Gossypium arboreum]